MDPFKMYLTCVQHYEAVINVLNLHNIKCSEYDFSSEIDRHLFINTMFIVYDGTSFIITFDWARGNNNDIQRIDYLDFIKKYSTPQYVFTTDDGVKMYEGDYYDVVYISDRSKFEYGGNTACLSHTRTVGPHERHISALTFANIENAKAYTTKYEAKYSMHEIEYMLKNNLL